MSVHVCAFGIIHGETSLLYPSLTLLHWTSLVDVFWGDHPGAEVTIPPKLVWPQEEMEDAGSCWMDAHQVSGGHSAGPEASFLTWATLDLRRFTTMHNTSCQRQMDRCPGCCTLILPGLLAPHFPSLFLLPISHTKFTQARSYGRPP